MLPIIAGYDEREVVIGSQQRCIIRTLRAELDAQRPNESRIATTLDHLMVIRRRRHALRQERIEDVRKHLAPVQQAKLLLMLPRLERDLARVIGSIAADCEGASSSD